MKRIGFTVIVVAALAACQSDRTFPPGPNALIRDANHNAGNAFFFWLSPVVNQHAPATQVFSGHLSPVVTITNLCTGGVVRTFSGADISVSNASYHVNWKTAADNLNSACTYRVTVTVGTKPSFGFADVDVVDNGRELKNVNTDEFIPLLDDRTLPLQFFIGVGSTCDPDGGSDCGEGVARPGENTLIVTNSGNAGVFIPAGAVDNETTITIQSVDQRFGDGDQCIPGLLDQFPGTPNTPDNGCYDVRADPPLADVNDNNGTFNEGFNATVGICPPIAAMNLDHATLDLIQIFRFDDVGDGLTVGLPNVQAPFLRCDPHFSPSFGSRPSLFGDLARALAGIVTPRPLYAGTRRMMFDLGAGGSTDGFSRFAWALPGEIIR